MKAVYRNLIFIVFYYFILHIDLFSQILNLDSLYISKPSDSERGQIIGSFNITLKDGDESRAKWSLYNPFYFNPNDTLPSVYSLVNCLRVIREQKFSEPLPFTDNAYLYMLSHFQLGGIELSLRTGTPYGGGNWIYLNANAAFWDGRTSAEPLKPFPDFSIFPYIYKIQLLLHETRHSDSNDPGHDPNISGRDTRFSSEGAYARDAIYYMWVYKYGINNSQAFKLDARDNATSILMTRFVEMPPTHSNPKVQSLINELLPKMRITAGNNQVGAVGTSLPVFLQISIFQPFSNYLWYQSIPVVFKVISVPPNASGYALSSGNSNTTSSLPASVSFRLGDKEGIYLVSAKAPILGTDSLIFSLSATGVTNIKDISTSGVTLYPIPVTDKLVIVFTEQLSRQSVTIYSSNGNEVYSSQITNSTTEVDMRKYSSGIYIVKIMTKGNVVLTRKIIKQ